MTATPGSARPKQLLYPAAAAQQPQGPCGPGEPSSEEGDGRSRQRPPRGPRTAAPGPLSPHGSVPSQGRAAKGRPVPRAPAAMRPEAKARSRGLRHGRSLTLIRALHGAPGPFSRRRRSRRRRHRPPVTQSTPRRPLPGRVAGRARHPPRCHGEGATFPLLPPPPPRTR